MSQQHRTQINLDKPLWERVKAEARRSGISVAALVRQVLGEHYGGGSRRRRKTWAQGLGAIAGIGDSGGAASSDDDEIYDED